MPHWINLSFYSTNKKVAYSSFIPRIKLPPLLKRNDEECHEELQVKKLKDEINFYSDTNTEYIHNSLYDYDAYDAQVFAIPNHTSGMKTGLRTKKSSAPNFDNSYSMSMSMSKDWDNGNHRSRKMSDPDIHHSYSLSDDSAPTTLRESMSQSTLIMSKTRKSMPLRAGRALINPFDPSHVTIKLTSNRRRWSHIFPKGPTGVLIQQHHYQAVPSKQSHEPAMEREYSLSQMIADDYIHAVGCVHHNSNSNGNIGRKQHSSMSTRSFEKFEDDYNRLSNNNTPVDRGSYLNESLCECDGGLY